MVMATGMGNLLFYGHYNKQDMDKMWTTHQGWIDVGPNAPLVCEYIGGSYQPAFVDQTASRYRDYVRRGGRRRRLQLRHAHQLQAHVGIPSRQAALETQSRTP